MNTEIKIGYQGLENSHSHQAAKQLSAQLSSKTITLVPLVTSAAVVKQLLTNEIDYGVLAIENTTAGIVIETQQALKCLPYTKIADYQHHVHHCLFKKSPSISLEEITHVASHIQALSQCSNYLNLHLSNCEKLEIADTAISALYLSQGVLSDTTAVICTKEAGLDYRLTLIDENIESSADNITSFILLKKQD